MLMALCSEGNSVAPFSPDLCLHYSNQLVGKTMGQASLEGGLRPGFIGGEILE